MISDMDIKSVWPILTLGIMIEVAWKVKVENIEAYMAGPNVRQVLCDMMPILKKNKFVFCYDLTLKDHSGQFLKVLLPTSKSKVDLCMTNGSKLILANF